jgi:hypothetical protein
VNKWFCVVVLALSLACQKAIQSPAEGVKKEPTLSAYREYFIPRDQHDALGISLQQVNKKELRFMVVFDSTCIYANRKPENARDINKLYGFSDCSSLHHNNSARVGWLWNGKAIELYAYCYSDSVRSNKLLGSLALEQAAELSIRVEPGQYIFLWDGKETAMARGCDSPVIGGFKLFPYFGGDETSPHDMRIFIKEIDTQ